MSTTILLDDYLNTIKFKLKNLNKIQIASLSSIITILIINFLILIYNYQQIDIIFIIFYECLKYVLQLITLILICCFMCLFYGNKNWNMNDKYLFLIFFSCCFIEFFIQFLNLNFFLMHFLFTFLLLSINFNEHQQLQQQEKNFFSIIEKNFSILFIIYVVRFYLCYSFDHQHIAQTKTVGFGYMAYVCVFCGILLAKYIEVTYTAITMNDNTGSVSDNGLLRIPKTESSNNLNTSTVVLQQQQSQQQLNCSKVSCVNCINSTNSLKQYYLKENLMLKQQQQQQRRKNLSNFSIFMPKRRTSLPIIPIRTDKTFSPDATILHEILGVCEDMLNDATIQQNTWNGLKAIQHLLNQSLSYFSYYSTPIMNANTTNSNTNLNGQNLSTSQIINNKFNKMLNVENIGSDSADESTPFISEKSHKRNKRSLTTSSNRRMSATLCSTTTSATGMPILDTQPIRQRSSSLKGTSTLLNQHLTTNRFFPCLSYPNEHNFKEHNRLLLGELTLNTNKNEQLLNITSEGKNLQNTSDYESGESPTNSDYNSDTDKLQLLDHTNVKKLEGIKEEQVSPVLKTSTSKLNLPWTPDDLENVELLNYIHDWSFPIFTFVEKSNNFVLSKLAYKIFQDVGLFQSFDIPIEPFIEFFHTLECGYKDLPYHNRIHAADVLHACYYLTTQSIPYFVPTALDGSKNLHERPKLNKYQNSTRINNEIYGCLGANFLPLELLALYCSAAMHDYDHPGRNNQFLVSTNSPLALLYNDRSVLENHHAAASWQLLKSDEKYNFLCNLDSYEWKRLRYMVLENILATDLNKHFLILAEFNSKANNANTETCGIDWKCEADRLLVGQVVIKLADICAPLKDKDLHMQWTERIMEEFYDQGDDEQTANLPISAYMDRRAPQVAKLQEHFIKNLVGSTCNAYTQAGLLPGILIEASDDDESSDMDRSELSSRDTDGDYNNNRKRKIVYSEITSNFKTNYEMWVEKVKQEQNLKN